MKNLMGLLIALAIPMTAWAGFQGINGSTSLGIFNKMKCSTGLTCTKVGDQFSIVSSPTISTGALSISAATATSATEDLIANAGANNGDKWRLLNTNSTQLFALQNNTSGSFVTKWSMTPAGNVTNVGTLTVTGATTMTGGQVASAGQWTNYGRVYETLTSGTDVTPGTTTVYLSQVFVHANATITGVVVNNAATCATSKWIVALFDSTGTPVANSNTAGVVCSGTDAYQTIAFTGTVPVVGPGVYWIGLYANGTGGHFRALKASSQGKGLAGSVAAQTFGTVVAVTLPTTFTADLGPAAFLY